MIARFTLHGEPVPKGRPRLARAGHIYTPRATQQAEDDIGWLFKAANPAWRPVRDVEYDVDLAFHVGRGRPDLDNLVKLVLDGLNRVAWADDSQVARFTACIIRRAEHPRTVVEVREISPDRVTPKP